MTTITLSEYPDVRTSEPRYLVFIDTAQVTKELTSKQIAVELAEKTFAESPSPCTLEGWDGFAGKSQVLRRK